MDKDVVRKYGSYLERTSWSLVFFGLLTQVSSEFAFPSYNIILGFWGAYCSFSRHGRATFGCIAFSFLGIILDIVFCAVNNASSPTFHFALSMLILCLFLKCVLIYSAAHFFAALGGAAAMDSSLHGVPMDMSRSGHFDNLGTIFFTSPSSSSSSSYSFPPFLPSQLQCLDSSRNNQIQS